MAAAQLDMTYNFELGKINVTGQKPHHRVMLDAISNSDAGAVRELVDVPWDSIRHRRVKHYDICGTPMFIVALLLYCMIFPSADEQVSLRRTSIIKCLFGSVNEYKQANCMVFFFAAMLVSNPPFRGSLDFAQLAIDVGFSMDRYRPGANKKFFSYLNAPRNFEVVEFFAKARSIHLLNFSTVTNMLETNSSTSLDTMRCIAKHTKAFQGLPSSYFDAAADRASFEKLIHDVPMKIVHSLAETIGPNHAKISDDCAICYDNYQAGDKIVTLPCQHQFHLDCMTSVVETKQYRCPYCRQYFV